MLYFIVYKRYRDKTKIDLRIISNISNNRAFSEISSFRNCKSHFLLLGIAGRGTGDLHSSDFPMINAYANDCQDF